MDGCIYRTKDGECELYAEGGKYTAFCDIDNCESKRPSNADRIRAMSDEELAEWLTNFTSSNVKPYATARGEMYRGSMLDWLKQEAKDG